MEKIRGRRPVKLWQLAAIAILAFGTTAVILGSAAWYANNKTHERAALEADAAQIAVTTKKTLDGYDDQIASAVALFSQPGLIDRNAFHSYVVNLDLYSRYKGIYGLGMISWVPASGLAAFANDWRTDGAPGFTVLPAGNRPAYCLVSRFEESNVRTAVPIVGYDMCTVKAMSAVLAAATATGNTQAAVESTLAAGPAYAGNFLLVAPVYSADPTTVAQRSSDRIGWVATLVDGTQFLEAALGPTWAHLGVGLYTGPAVAAKQLVVSSPSGFKADAPGSVIEHIDVAGTWTMSIRSLPGAPGPANPLLGPAALFVMGTLLNLALAGFVWDLGRGRLRATRSFVTSERRFQSMASSTPVGILEMDAEGTTQYFNPRLNEIAGVDDHFWRDHSWLDCIHPDDRSSAVAIALSARTSRDDTGASLRLLRPTGEVRDVRVLASPVSGVGGRPTTFVATVQDVTEEVAATEALAFQAMHDSLTGLPNRALFLDRLSVELSHAARSGSALAVMFLDLDRFKVVNDGLGHHAGDELLKAVGVRLLDVVRAGETVARLGGDEFTFIFHDVEGVTQAAVVAQRILDTLQQPITIEGGEVVVTGSIGIVLPGPGAEAATVLRDADAGMYRAKEMGRARFEIFDEEQRRAVVERLAIENDLRHGIERGELRLYYQPLVSTSTASPLGVEALVRWEHPTRGLLFPDEFVSVAEETGLIVALGEWVFRTAAADCARWDRDPHGPHLEIVAVNVSARQLASSTLCPMVHKALRTEGVDPGRISVEITESVIMSDDHVTRRSLADLRTLGVSMAIDDFGTGYSSLASLSKLPVNVVKIDKSFVDGLRGESEGGPLVVAIVEMAHALGLRTIAEGVENESQRQFLARCGCDMAQGYLWSPALPADEFARWWQATVASPDRHDKALVPSRSSSL